MTVLEEELTSAKTDITDLKDHLNSVIKELNVITDGGIEKKLELLEEELYGVKAENIEMRNHFNSMIKELNAITFSLMKNMVVTSLKKRSKLYPHLKDII